MQAHVKRHLQECSKGCQHIVLWLDCDREGENICFEVLECCLPHMSQARSLQCVWRAKFSAISEKEIVSAMGHLGEPNENESKAVDARQELDLKVPSNFDAIKQNDIIECHALFLTTLLSHVTQVA
jgi:DNA topoisomerase III